MISYFKPSIIKIGLATVLSCFGVIIALVIGFTGAFSESLLLVQLSQIFDPFLIFGSRHGDIAGFILEFLYIYFLISVYDFFIDYFRKRKNVL